MTVITVNEGETKYIVGPHHGEAGHGGSPDTHYFAETGDDDHFGWVDQDGSTPNVIDIFYDFRTEAGFANLITVGQKARAEDALDAWEGATNGKINFVLNTVVSSSLIVNIGTGDLAALGSTSGPGGTLGLGGGSFSHGATSHTISSGVAWQDKDETWDEGFNNGNPGVTIDYFTVVAQEIGHAIGLGHTNDLAGPDLMDGSYTVE